MNLWNKKRENEDKQIKKEEEKNSLNGLERLAQSKLEQPSIPKANGWLVWLRVVEGWARATAGGFLIFILFLLQKKKLNKKMKLKIGEASVIIRFKTYKWSLFSWALTSGEAENLYVKATAT